MANGRLGSVVLGPIETAKVYSNSSGNAAAVSLVAKTLSSTSNASITIKLDSADVTPQTTTVIEANSYGPSTVFLDTNSSYTSVVGDFTFTPTPVYTKKSDSSTASLEDIRGAYEIIPEQNSSVFSNTAIPITYNSTTYFYTPSTYFGAALPDHRKATVANLSAPSGSIATRTMSYYSDNVVTDIYSKASISVGLDSNGNMSQTMYANGSANGQNITSGTWWRQYVNGSQVYGPTQYRQNLFLSGGLLIGWDSINTGRGTFVVYNKDNTSNNVEKIIEYVNSSGILWGFRYNPSGGFTNTNGAIVWMTYNPSNNKHYILMLKDSGSYGYYKFNTEVALAKIATSGSSTFSEYASIAAINTGAGGTLFEEIDAPSSWSMSNVNWLRRPIKVVGANKWVFQENDGTNWNYWETTDLENWTKRTATSYYTKVVSDNELIKSDASDTVYISSNISSVADSGTLEYKTSFNAYEKTGLVLSNGDNVYIKNDSQTQSIAVNIMGYEG